MNYRYIIFFFSFIFYINKSFTAYDNVDLDQESTLINNFGMIRTLEQPLVFQVSLESSNAIVGGLGCVIRDLNKNLNNDHLNSFSITLFYPFLKKSIDTITLGFFKNFLIDREITTEVFLNGKDKQILFSPDSTIADCCNIVTSVENIYEPKQMFLRNIYFNAAVAKFSHLMNPDIVQLHAWQTALTAALIKNIYNPQRLANSIKPLSVISTFHILNDEQGKDTDRIFQMVGLPKSTTGFVNLAETSILESDYITSVSLGLVKCFENSKACYGIYPAFKSKSASITNITNGIDYVKFSPYLENNLGFLHLEKNFTTQNLAYSKQQVKSLLFEHKLIPSSEKPLMLYVGRFSQEKGIRYFEHIIDTWLSLGGQMVIMGVMTQDTASRDTILRLQKKQFDPNFQNLRIYTNFKEDQLDKISEKIPLQKGKAIRFSADWTCIPSEIESCSLIAMESLCFGTPIFTSWVQGLKDMCVPYNTYHPFLDKFVDQTNFNAVNFHYNPENFSETLSNISKKLTLVYKITTGDIFDQEILLLAQKRMIESSNLFDWNAPDGALKKYQKLYQHLTGGTLQEFSFNAYPRKMDDNHLVQSLIGKFGKYPPHKISFQYTKYQPFILSTLKQARREPESLHNFKTSKEILKVDIVNGQIYTPQQSIVFDTKSHQNDNKQFYVTYVLNKKGHLFLGAFSHVYFLKSKPGNPNYGYSKPLACGGDALIENGKFKYIDNRSGHYLPDLTQLMLALHYFYQMDLISNDCEIREESSGNKISIEDVKNFDAKTALSQYPKFTEIVSQN